jgi:hypothetical protein
MCRRSTLAWERWEQRSPQFWMVMMMIKSLMMKMIMTMMKSSACICLFRLTGVASNAGSSTAFIPGRLQFVARHYFPAGYQAGTTEGVPDQYVFVLGCVGREKHVLLSRLLITDCSIQIYYVFRTGTVLVLAPWNGRTMMPSKNCFTGPARLVL